MLELPRVSRDFFKEFNFSFPAIVWGLCGVCDLETEPGAIVFVPPATQLVGGVSQGTHERKRERGQRGRGCKGDDDGGGGMA